MELLYTVGRHPRTQCGAAPLRCAPKTPLPVAPKWSAPLAAILIAASWCCSPAAAGEVQYLAYLDEEVASGHAWVLETTKSPGCTASGPAYKCLLNYALNKDGVPTASFDPGTRIITPGDVVLTGEPFPEFKEDARSDVIRFPSRGTTPAGAERGAASILFYSQADDTDNDGTIDVKKLPPSAGVVLTEIDLGAYFKENPVTLRGKPDAALGLDTLLRGRSGAFYVANQGDVGGVANSAAEGPVGYIFVSDVDKVTSTGKSVHFDAQSSLLSFSSDSVIDTGTDGDPLVGADVNMPTLQLQGTDANGSWIFRPLADAQLTLGLGPCTYLRSTVSSMAYSPSENLFSAVLSGLSAAGVDPSSPLYDPSLGCIDSSFLHYLDSVFNPNSLLFDPLESLTITYRPQNDFFAQTAGFSSSAESPITNFISVGEVPEPGMAAPLAAVLLCFLWFSAPGSGRPVDRCSSGGACRRGRD